MPPSRRLHGSRHFLSIVAIRLPNDVQIDILFCGVCHSDLHTARNEWGGTTYPCVPGHEIVGRVVASRQRRERFQGRRSRRGRLHGRLLPQVRELSRRLRAILRRSPHFHLQQPGQTHRRRSPTAGIRRASSSISISSCASPINSTSPRPRRSCAPASRPTRRCAIGRSAEGTRSGSSDSAVSVTWR